MRQSSCKIDLEKKEKEKKKKMKKLASDGKVPDRRIKWEVGC